MLHSHAEQPLRAPAAWDARLENSRAAAKRSPILQVRIGELRATRICSVPSAREFKPYLRRLAVDAAG